MSTAQRTWRFAGASSGEKSAPLPSPPAISTSGPRAPRPSIAATVAPTFVPLESLIQRTPRRAATVSQRCGSPA